MHDDEDWSENWEKNEKATKEQVLVTKKIYYWIFIQENSW